MATTLPQSNPANASVVAPVADPKRVPMNSPTQRLRVPEISGFKTHWMRGTADRIQQALAAGYTFVSQDEVALNYRGLAEDPTVGGNTDLGSRVSISAGRTDDSGNVVRLILMKIPVKFADEDKTAYENHQESIAEALRSGTTGIKTAPGSDTSNRYTGTENRNIFNRRA
jgi:hypothetical protein